MTRLFAGSVCLLLHSEDLEVALDSHFRALSELTAHSQDLSENYLGIGCGAAEEHHSFPFSSNLSREFGQFFA